MPNSKKKTHKRSLNTRLLGERKKKIAHLVQKGEVDKAISQFEALKNRIISDNPYALEKNLFEILEGIPTKCEAKEEYLRKIAANWNYPSSHPNNNNSSCVSQCAIGVLNNYGEHLFKMGQYENAISVFEQAMQIYSDCIELLKSYGFTLHASDYYSRAIEIYQKILQKNPDNIYILYNYSEALQQIGQYDIAFEQYDLALKISPNNLHILIGYAAALSNYGKYDEALKKFDRILRIKPDETVTLTNYGITLTKLQQYDSAIAKFKDALQITPENPNILFCYGYTLATSGQFEGAVQQYKKAFQIEPHNKEFLTAYTNILEKEGFYKTAVEVYKQAAKNSPQDIVILNDYAVALCKAKKFNEGIEIFKRVLHHAPDNISWLTNYATVLGELKQYKNAIDLFEQILEKAPKSVRALVNYGEVFYKSGEYKLAIEKYEKALEVDPQSIPALFAYANALFDCGQTNTAFEKYEQALEIDPDERTLLFNYAGALLHSGKYEIAAKTYQHILDLNPSNKKFSLHVLNNYGISLLSMGEYEAAIKTLEHALNILPENPDLLNNYGVAKLAYSNILQNEALVFQNEALKILSSPSVSTKYNHSILQKTQQTAKAFKLEKDYSALEKELEGYKKPVVYTEGDTDEIILKVAWVKLYGQKPMPFRIKSSNLLATGELSSCSSNEDSKAGTGILAKYIGSVRADSPSVAIALFDHDHEGIVTYQKLPKFFHTHQINHLEVKISEHRKSAAFLLPIPPHKKKYAVFRNLCIEFYFEESALSMKKDGYGLVFRYPKLETKIQTQGSPVVKIEECNLPESRIVDDGKKVFAKEIVPKLAPSEFESFKLLFEQIEKILNHLTQPPN